MKIKECCTVESQECIAKGIYSMWISTKVIAKEAKAGQFISLFSKDGSRLLPRPISLCEIDREGGRLRIVYRVAGAGTEEFSHLKAGDEVDILGPLGNGFPIEEGKGKRVMLMGGGIGVPPMLQTAKDLGTDTIICCGYRDELFLNEEFAAAGDLHIATEDGSAGVKGNVMDAVREGDGTAVGTGVGVGTGVSGTSVTASVVGTGVSVEPGFSVLSSGVSVGSRVGEMLPMKGSGVGVSPPPVQEQAAKQKIVAKERMIPMIRFIKETPPACRFLNKIRRKNCNNISAAAHRAFNRASAVCILTDNRQNFNRRKCRK